MDNLTMHAGRPVYPHHLYSSRDSAVEIEPINGSRDQFIVNLKLGLLALMRDRFEPGFVGNAPDCADHVEAWALALSPKLVDHRAAQALGFAKFVNCI
jgi:hypothetical protein